MPTQKKNPIENLKNYEAQLAELNAQYKRRVKMIQDQKRTARGKLEAARTHAIIQGSTYVTKALGLDDYYNITLDDLMKNDFKIAGVEGKNCSNFDFVFAEYRKLMTDLGDFFYNRPDLVGEIQEFLQIRKSGENIEIDPTVEKVK